MPCLISDKQVRRVIDYGLYTMIPGHCVILSHLLPDGMTGTYSRILLFPDRYWMQAGFYNACCLIESNIVRITKGKMMQDIVVYL